MASRNVTIEKLLAVADPLATSMGFEILLAEECSERGQRCLRVFLDKPSGIEIEDCARFSRALDPILDVETDLQGKYNLEVSSPGLNRPLSKLEHFLQAQGKVLRIQMVSEVAGRHNFKGVLLGVEHLDEDPVLRLQENRQEHLLFWKEIKKANLDFFATEEIQKSTKKKQSKRPK